MPHGQIYCDALHLLFAGASLGADTLKPFLSLFTVYTHTHHSLVLHFAHLEILSAKSEG